MSAKIHLFTLHAASCENNKLVEWCKHANGKGKQNPEFHNTGKGTFGGIN